MADDPKKKKKKADPADSLSPEDMAAALDEAIGDDADDSDDDLDMEIDGDGDDDDATSQAAIAAIISSAHLPTAEASEESEPEEPAAAPEEPDRPELWVPVEDVTAGDIELIATEEPITEDTLWDQVQDTEVDDMEITAAAQVELKDPWAPIGNEPLDPDPGVLAVPPPPPLELPPPVALLLESGEAQPIAAAPAATPAKTLPWRGTARIESPILPDQLYVADVTQEGSHLLVAAWELAEDAPGGRLLRVRLADDGAEIELEAAAPHEPSVALEVTVAGHTLSVRAALTIERGERGLRLGRDVLAGRFIVDPSTSNWPKPEA
ncbi:MAG: hypothetical protein GY898_09225 [Proteobacteria bacterium]|nr:hypothetical protein [Pseudomonadota bacterium]